MTIINRLNVLIKAMGGPELDDFSDLSDDPMLDLMELKGWDFDEQERTRTQ